MKTSCSVFFVMVVVAFLACGQNVKPDEAAIKASIQTVLKLQVEAWNEGDTDKFMEGYLKSDRLRFASGGDVSYGWNTLNERYKRVYPDEVAMGQLSFTELDITILADDAALVFGKWALQRETDAPRGYFTLLFQKSETGWQIVADHTSSANINEDNDSEQ